MNENRTSFPIDLNFEWTYVHYFYDLRLNESPQTRIHYGTVLCRKRTKYKFTPEYQGTAWSEANQ